MTQKYTKVTWQDETTSQQGTLINAERLDQMQTAHHFADGFEEVDTAPTADPDVDYHKVVYCTADSTFYRWDGTQWVKDIDDDTKALLLAHEADHNNPHVVTKAQVGLGNVDNTADLDKPVSTAMQTALDAKVDDSQIKGSWSGSLSNDNIPGEKLVKDSIDDVQTNVDNVASDLSSHKADISNPHSVTKSQVGLGDVMNYGMESVPASGSLKYVSSDGIYQADKIIADALQAHKDNTTNPHAVTKTQVGLSNVDNTADIDKPVSTAQSQAIAQVNNDLTGRIDNLQGQINTKVAIADGVKAWDSTVTYGANSFTNYNGTLYRSLRSDNTNHNPVSSPTWWTEYAPGSGSSTGLIGPDNVYTEDIGDGASTTITVTHNLGSLDVLWAIWSNSDKHVAGVTAVKTSTNVLTLTFSAAPASDEYRVLVFRPGDAARLYTQTFTAASTVVITHNLGRLPSGISVYSPSGQKVGVRMTVDTTTATLSFAGYDNGNYTIQVVA